MVKSFTQSLFLSQSTLLCLSLSLTLKTQSTPDPIVVGVGDQDVVVAVHDYTTRKMKERVRGLAVGVPLMLRTARHRRYASIVRRDPADAVVAAVRHNQVAVYIKRQPPWPPETCRSLSAS